MYVFEIPHSGYCIEPTPISNLVVLSLVIGLSIQNSISDPSLTISLSRRNDLFSFFLLVR